MPTQTQPQHQQTAAVAAMSDQTDGLVTRESGTVLDMDLNEGRSSLQAEGKPTLDRRREAEAEGNQKQTSSDQERRNAAVKCQTCKHDFTPENEKLVTQIKEQDLSKRLEAVDSKVFPMPLSAFRQSSGTGSVVHVTVKGPVPEQDNVSPTNRIVTYDAMEPPTENSGVSHHEGSYKSSRRGLNMQAGFSSALGFERKVATAENHGPRPHIRQSTQYPLQSTESQMANGEHPVGTGTTSANFELNPTLAFLKRGMGLDGLPLNTSPGAQPLKDSSRPYSQPKAFRGVKILQPNIRRVIRGAYTRL